MKDFLEFAQAVGTAELARMTAEPILRDIRNLLAPQLEKRDISLRIDELSDDCFNADPQQLKQVLINLVQNAAESIDQHGHVTTLRARSSTARLNGHPQPVVILETQDTGKGIPPDVQNVCSIRSTAQKAGTGLGLSIAARIVEKHGGALEFQTQVNRGTTFGIILPTVE